MTTYEGTLRMRAYKPHISGGTSAQFRNFLSEAFWLCEQIVDGRIFEIKESELLQPTKRVERKRLSSFRQAGVDRDADASGWRESFGRKCRRTMRIGVNR